MNGIHLHPHDIIDEGTEKIFSLLNVMGDIQYIFPQVNTIFERNPYPKGILPHNPVHEFVQGEGTWHVPIKVKEIYENLYQKVDSSVQKGEDSIQLLKEGSSKTTFEIIPWLNLLNGDFQGNVANNGVVDFLGNEVEYWLCPNGPDVVPMWSKLISALTEKYGYTTYLIDRIRFPDWAGKQVNPKGIFSCFCSHCKKGMDSVGINIPVLIDTMNRVANHLKNQDFHYAVQTLFQSEVIKQWIQFRQDSVSNFVEDLLKEVQKVNSDIQLWLDLWPPSYAWLLGQDYERLTKASNTLKHFPYHKLGGGADVQGFIEFFADTPAKQEEAFQAFLTFFDLQYDITYETFREHGYPISFVKNENDKVRELSKANTNIFSGIQMWNIEEDHLIEALEAAENSDANDVLYYCYGWADEKLFSAVGKWNILKVK
ncbi:hypothetical protein ACFFF5_03025 [Lederbergia wuyishanensis]|uniref:Uncharacterized protein n=1 Tax=Lederbergia wuyishanensis TaxID=1347903 RepID=A0ABU0D0B0_9BACI|nr:hypothetical protein [Lederbergia wuyishanensis]MCJ8006445.1 hypothetical protein [Lederbergia wuyishanensis]MDQ0341820.1 hypothetical protein [Lederbergia wuyishanensis]